MIYQSDIVEWLKNYDGPKYHAVLSDPPYGLAFMGKSWDNMAPKEFQEWVTEWGSLLLGVVYPGAIGMFFGGTRTFHRLTVGLEDAGWEIFDVCMFLYGCVDEDTEVLTPNGWTRYHKDILQQQILCYNKENDSFSWECPTYVYHYDYADTAYRVQSDTTDQLVSRNHRCLVEREGVLVFESAETAARQSEIRVPVLEGVRELRQAISNASTRGSETKSVLSRVPTGEAKNTTTAQAHERTQSNAYGLPRVRTAVLSTECLSRESDYPLLQPGVQRQGSRARVGETRMERTFGGVTRSTQSLRIKGRKKSSLERRSDIPQAQGKLCQSVYQIRALSGRVYFNGTGRRVCNGTPFSSGSGSWQTTIKDGSCTSQKSRRNRQSASKSRIICIKSRSQDLRTSRIARTDLARITPVYYQGIMWCPTVSSGAFVARRNGQIFITGNSGFPKSHDISKALDREAVIDCPHCKGAGFLIEAGPSGVDDYERVLCPECDGTGKKRGVEREVVGTVLGMGKQNPEWNGTAKGRAENSFKPEYDLTAPATPDAHRWQGYGTALKPAYEIIVTARAPFDTTAERDIIVGNLSKLEAQLWLLLPASIVENSSTSNPTLLNEALNIAQWTVEKITSTRDALRGQMDMSQFELATTSSLNIVSSWLNILDALSNLPSTSTIATALSTTIDWKTLSYLTSQITLADIHHHASRQLGFESIAPHAESRLTAVSKNMSAIQQLFAAERATSSVRANLVDEDSLPDLKPDYTPIILARAPRAPHTYAALAREFGTGAINVDGARVGTEPPPSVPQPIFNSPTGRTYNMKTGKGRNGAMSQAAAGRWPANVILDEHAAAALDAMSGETKVDSRSLSTYNIRTVDKTEVNLCCANASIAVVSSMLGHQMSSVDTGVSVAANAVTLRGEKPEKTRHGDIFAPQTDGGIGSGENSEAAKSTHNLSIDGCGNSTMVPFQTGMKSTTSTEIRQTTTCQTCGSYLQVSMTISTNASARITRLGLMVSSAAGVNDAANTSLSLNLPLAVPEHIAAIVSRVQDWLLGNGEKKTANTITPTCENTASDGPSRFFYTAKAAAWERTAGLSERSKHPTMKPIRLTEYLATMLLPPVFVNEIRRLLVPFSGVGSEMIGARLAGWDEIDGIEQDADYCVDAYNRVVWWSQFSSYEEAQKHYKKNKDADDFGGWS